MDRDTRFEEVAARLVRRAAETFGCDPLEFAERLDLVEALKVWAHPDGCATHSADTDPEVVGEVLHRVYGIHGPNHIPREDLRDVINPPTP